MFHTKTGLLATWMLSSTKTLEVQQVGENRELTQFLRHQKE